MLIFVEQLTIYYQESRRGLPRNWLGAHNVAGIVKIGNSHLLEI